jgi:hypothetical protein
MMYRRFTTKQLEELIAENRRAELEKMAKNAKNSPISEESVNNTDDVTLDRP